MSTSPENEIESGQAFCIVDSGLTGKRLISVPFSDHGALLLHNPDDSQALLTQLRGQVDQGILKYVEIRPTERLEATRAGYAKSDSFVLHSIDLSEDLPTLFHGFHKDCVQRKIRRAERESLSYVEGRDEELIQQFYQLLLKTNRRRGTAPQPIRWFRNLAECLGERLKIRLAAKNSVPIAAILTLAYKKTMTYKYGCSDERYHNLGGMPFLFWKAIQDAKANGMNVFDLGRSDVDHDTLIAFKEHFGARREVLQYWRYPGTASHSQSLHKSTIVKTVLSVAPDFVLRATGSLLYKHMA